MHVRVDRDAQYKVAGGAEATLLLKTCFVMLQKRLRLKMLRPTEQHSRICPPSADASGLQAYALASTQAQSQAQGSRPQTGGQSARTDAAPVTSLGCVAAAGSAQGGGGGGDALFSQDWHPANVVLKGLVQQPVAGEVGAPLLQSPTQLPVFEVDSVLWPNQVLTIE